MDTEQVEYSNMASLEYLQKQKCMLEQLIVKQKRILEQCSGEDAKEQQMERIANLMHYGRMLTIVSEKIDEKRYKEMDRHRFIPNVEQEQTYTFIEKTRQGSTAGFKNTRD